MEKEEYKPICELCQKAYEEDEVRSIGDITVCNYCEDHAK